MRFFPLMEISVGNSMICSDIWLNITSGNYAKHHAQIMLLIVYTTTLRWFVIFTCRYFKLSWNTTALSQSNCRNFSCSSIKSEIPWLFPDLKEIFFHWPFPDSGIGVELTDQSIPSVPIPPGHLSRICHFLKKLQMPYGETRLFIQKPHGGAL